MKVLLINGSPREHGNTFLALSEVSKTLNEEGVATEIVSIGKSAVQGCIACGMCGRIGKCTFNDNLYYRVWRAVKDGIDGLVIGSPVYYGGPNGSLCALLDRVFYSLGPLVSSQYWNMVYGQAPGQASLDEEGMQTMRTLARNMAWMIKHLNTEEHPQQEQPVWTNFIR